MWEHFNLVERFSYSKFSAGALWWWAFTLLYFFLGAEQSWQRLWGQGWWSWQRCFSKWGWILGTRRLQQNKCFEQNESEYGKDCESGLCKDCEKRIVMLKTVSLSMRKKKRIVTTNCANVQRLWTANKDCDDEFGKHLQWIPEVTPGLSEHKARARLISSSSRWLSSS